MAPTRKQSIAPDPHEASLAEDKGTQDRIDSNLEIQWHHAPISKDLQEED
jgi:hypothetical protein